MIENMKIYKKGVESAILVENKKWKYVRSKDYNYNFNKETGFFARWGETKEDDPDCAPFPEILDLEISTICSGINGKPCKWCYKSNTCQGENMSFDTFVKIFNKFPRVLCQLALGIGDIDANPDLEKILKYCRENTYNYVVPNITINGWNLTDKYADMLAELTGATAVSRYNPNDVCYDAVKKLTDRGLKQVNIHQILCQDSLNDCYKVIDDSFTDTRLEKLNAIVFLLMKPKGKRNRSHKLMSFSDYKSLVDYALDKNAKIGFDSCGCEHFLSAVKSHENYKEFYQYSEPCESTAFSCYIDVKGKFFPCSFSEGVSGWEDGVDVLGAKDFTKDVWNNSRIVEFRKKLINSKCLGGTCRTCPIYDLSLT